MKMTNKTLGAIVGTALFAFAVQSCGGEATPVEDFAKEKTEEKTEEIAEEKVEESKYAAGKEVYDRTCIACHQANGKGMENAFPPLAGADYLLEDPQRAIAQVIHGSNEEMVVNGVTYNGVMPAQDLNNQEVMDVINYVLNTWGNDGGEVTLDEVQAQRDAG